jgi:hypothetical protein
MMEETVFIMYASPVSPTHSLCLLHCNIHVILFATLKMVAVYSFETSGGLTTTQCKNLKGNHYLKLFDVIS